MPVKIAADQNVVGSYITRLLRLAFIAANITKAISPELIRPSSLRAS